jgi:DHA3 family tetracycline resistance protein-like MFS transporter
MEEASMSFARFPKFGAVPVYIAVVGVGSAAFMMYAVVSSVYRITEAGLNPLELILVGTVLEISAFLFEIPTGVVADVYSRRLSLIIGTFLIGAGFIVEGLFPIFGAILVAQVLWGVGSTFGSGAQEAWIADEVGDRDAGRVFLRGSQAARIGGIVGMSLGVALASGYTDLPIPDLAVPMIAGGCVHILLGVFMVLAMPEEGFHPAPIQDRKPWTAMSQTFIAGVRFVRGRPALVAIVAVALFFGASSEPMDRFWQLHLLTITGFDLPALGPLEPVVWWGIISAATMLLGIGAIELIRRYVDVDNPRVAVRTLSALNTFTIAGVVVFAVTENFALAIAAYLVYQVVRGAGGPVKRAWINQQLESNVRATVFSMHAQADAFGQVAVGPAMGVVATVATVRAALLVVAALLVPPQAIYAFIARLGERPPDAR